jgi:hypothetical protein
MQPLDQGCAPAAQMLRGHAGEGGLVAPVTEDSTGWTLPQGTGTGVPYAETFNALGQQCIPVLYTYIYILVLYFNAPGKQYILCV